MGDKEAVIRIKAKNEADAGIGSVIASLKSINSATSDLTRTFAALEKLTVFSTIGVGIEQVVSKAIDMANEFGQVDRTMTALRVAVGNNEQSFSRMTNLIDTVSKKTLSSKDSIEHLVMEMAALGKSDADIERITNASVALSNVTGDSLDASFQKINATFAGSSGKLEKLVPELGNLTSAQLTAGAAVDLINEKLGATSDSMAGGWLQATHNLGLAFDDFKEKLGEITSRFLTPFVQRVSQTFLRGSTPTEITL